MVSPTQLLLLGGRYQPSGLHQFALNNNNFPNPNTQMMVINPATGSITSFSVLTLGWPLAGALSAANQASFYDRPSGYLYVVGGYGPMTSDDNPSNYGTFGSMIRFNAAQVVNAILSNSTDQKRAAAIAPLIQQFNDQRLAVTGADLFLQNGQFFLVFGQTATGMYEPFGNGHFTQTYTCNVAQFTINPQNFSSGILAYGASSPNNDYHRRDGNVLLTRDPSTGATTIGAYGGVFPPGIIGAYSRPVFITSGPQLQEPTTQLKFGAYDCPVISAYSQKGQTTYETFFGGIGHYFFFQSPSQAAAYQKVAQEGRNDGMPFVADISTFVQPATGSTQEWIWPAPVPAIGFPPPDNQPFPSDLRGAGATFIPIPSASVLGADGVVQLDQLPSTPVQIGWIYGGIEAQNPLPLVPNTGTQACAAMYSVSISATPSGAYDAKYAIEAKGTATTPGRREAANKKAGGGK
jgi:hypothetical protein